MIVAFLLINNFSLCQGVSDGLIAFFPFDGNANNDVGSNHGQVYGATLTTDRFGNTNHAYEFDGINDYIAIPHSEVLNFGYNDDFTISVWVKIANQQRDLIGTNNEIISKWDANRGTSYPYAIRYNNGTAESSSREKISALRWDSESCNNNPTILHSCKISTDEWHHLVLMKQGNTLYSYQDGLLTGQRIDNTSPSCNTKNSFPILVGKRDLNQRYFTGSIDDISFYNRALTEEEINILFTDNSWAKPTNFADFVSYDFPEQTQPSIIDDEKNTIQIEIPCNVNIKSIRASFNTTHNTLAYVNGEIQISGVTVNDFTSPVKYTVVDELNCISTVWTVTVIQETLPDEDIKSRTDIYSFLFPGITNTANIDSENSKIEVELLCSSSTKNLTPIFDISSNSIALVSDKEQVSGVTNLDFDSPLTYTIEDNQGCASRNWAVIVTIQSLHFEDIKSLTDIYNFHFPDITNTVNIDSENSRIEIELICSSSSKNLTPSFEISSNSIALVSDKEQVSGVTNLDFDSPLTYTIKDNQGCASRNWAVIVTKQSLHLEDIDPYASDFFIPNVITPNQDDYNEFFMVGTLHEKSELIIYNRYGKEVYYSLNYMNQFNGSNLSGGVYYYTLRNPCFNELFKGVLSIIK